MGLLTKFLLRCAWGVPLVFFVSSGAYGQLEAPKSTNTVNSGHQFQSAETCRTCHETQYNQWRSSMMGYSSLSPVIHTLERAENEFVHPVAGQGRFGRTPNAGQTEAERAENRADESGEDRTENRLFCQKCHAPVAVLSDVLPDYSQYPAEMDSHEILVDLAANPSNYDDPNNPDPNLQNRAANAAVAIEGVTCTVCHRMAGIERNSNPPGMGPRPNFAAGEANSAFLYQGNTTRNYGPFNNFENNGFDNRLGAPVGQNVINLDFPMLTMRPNHETEVSQLLDSDGIFDTDPNSDTFGLPLGGTTQLGNDGVARPFMKTGEFCGVCHDVRIPMADPVVGEDFRRVENLFTEWKNSPWNNNNNEPGNGEFLTNALANPRGAAKKLDGSPVGMVDPNTGEDLKQITTCQDCHMSMYMTDVNQPPGIYEQGKISDLLSAQDRTVTNHRFIGVDRTLIGTIPDISVISSQNQAMFPDINLSGVDTGDDPIAGQTVADARSILLQKAVDFKITSGSVVGNELPIKLSVENVGAGHNIPAGLSQERQVWIEIYVRDKNDNVVYKSGYLINPAHGDPIEDPLGEEYCLAKEHEPECNLAGFQVALDKRLQIIPNPLNDNKLFDPGPDFDLVNYQNGFTLGLDANGDPSMFSGNPEVTREKVFSQFIGDSIMNTNALRPFEKNIEEYNVPVYPGDGPFKVDARLRFRPLPPEFLESLAKNENSRITESVILANKVIEMEQDQCVSGSVAVDGYRACDPVTPLSLGRSFSCAVSEDGKPQCWGNGGSGQLGDGEYEVYGDGPNDVVGINSGIKMLATGYFHTCGLKDDKTVACWGDGGRGQLGDGNTSYHSTNTPYHINPEWLSDVDMIAAGDHHTCALLEDRTVKCWGYNDKRQLGQGTNTTYRIAVPSLVTTQESEPLDDVESLALGGQHSCALLLSGEVVCWGFGSRGQLGDGSTSYHTTGFPQKVQGLGYKAVSIAAGTYNSCAVLLDGSVKCWGGGAYGALGNGSTQNVATAQDVLGLNQKATKVALGIFHGCALLEDSSVKCWGLGNQGQLGDGNNSDHQELTAISVPGLNGVVDIASNEDHTCAAFIDGSIKCWGKDDFNQTGVEGIGSELATPSYVEGYGPQSCVSPENIVPNCTFDIPTATNWNVLSHNGASIYADYGGEELRTNIYNDGYDVWHVQARTSIDLWNAGSYTLRFQARADSPRQINVSVGHNGSSDGNWVSYQTYTVSLTTEMQTFEFQVGSAPVDSNAVLDFNLGNRGNIAVTIDEIYLAPNL